MLVIDRTFKSKKPVNYFLIKTFLMYGFNIKVNFTKKAFNFQLKLMPYGK